MTRPLKFATVRNISAGFTIPRLLNRLKTFGLKEDLTRTAMTSRTLFAASWVCDCCLPPTSRLVCGHLQWHADGSAATAAGDVRSTSMDRHREHHDFHRLVGHV